MARFLFATAVAAVFLLAGSSVFALEFMADQITRVNGHSRKANIYYRDDMWRLEHHDVGPVNVTIVRKDKQLMWLILSRMKHFKTVPYDAAQAPKVSEHLDGEISREEIGKETLQGHPTTLYLVTVRKSGSASTNEAETEQYYQWLATDMHFPLKLAKKDGNWVVEYKNVRIKPLSDFLFQLPVNFQPLERFDEGEERPKSPVPPPTSPSKPEPSTATPHSSM